MPPPPPSPVGTTPQRKERERVRREVRTGRGRMLQTWDIWRSSGKRVFSAVLDPNPRGVGRGVWSSWACDLYGRPAVGSGHQMIVPQFIGSHDLKPTTPPTTAPSTDAHATHVTPPPPPPRNKYSVRHIHSTVGYCSSASVVSIPHLAPIVPGTVRWYVCVPCGGPHRSCVHRKAAAIAHALSRAHAAPGPSAAHVHAVRRPPNPM